ncbi:MAG: RDD family protein [Hyphomicrobiaceae bacterium]|nr:RDD family protein [Hyphomicrobiaceae bacterium]MCC0024478.1 RDD family protein [Hyphomicrobiaceae bacterium]
MSEYLPDPSTAPELFEGVLTRRVVAYIIDVVIMFLICVAVLLIGTILGFVTFGLVWAALVFAIPASIIIYYAATLGSPRRATIGMQMQDIVLTPTHGLPLDGWKAFMHPLIFWLTCWFLPPFNYIFALFTPRRQMIHDLLTGTLMVRKSPMVQHWQNA